MPTSEKVLNLIKYIVCYATEHDISLTTVRLVKFIYLADLYHARFKSGETITRYPWAFINFGPYCREAMQAIDEAALNGLINRKALESLYSDKDYYLFTCHDDDYASIKKDFPVIVIFEIQHAIRKYGDDTAHLLDYVYFNTEPMENVRKGDYLDFTRAKLQEPIKVIETKELSKKDVEIIKAQVKKLRDRHMNAMARLLEDERDTEKWKDELYFQALESLDDEPLSTGLKGTARIINGDP
jgi:hypothetical protein